jgi:archaellum biogenesis ATPase FlaH
MKDKIQKIVGVFPFYFEDLLISLMTPKFDSGFKVYQHNSRVPIISSGDSTLDELLGGGFHKDLVYLLYGDKKKTTNVLLTTSVISQKSFSNGGLGERIKIAFIDGNNRFNPYNVSKFAVTQKLSPTTVLENILIARAFTWDQMIELLENKISTLGQMKVVLISGITTLFQSYERQTFEDLLRAIDGIKKILERTKPLIIITAPLNEYSLFRPKGGKILSHFGNVLAMINDDERYVEYILVQHPFLPENRLLKWKPRLPKRKLSNPTKNTTIDCWF